ncbi:MAG: DUF1579 family protein, partial [Planctomycetota bacterium]|nr:DUF1579 family protein [Planctomycetota bacterium]
MTNRAFKATYLILLVTLTASAQEQAANPKDEVLQRFVGVWDLKSTLKPAKWNPEGGEFTGKESTVWTLKNRVILIRDMSQPDGRKGLYISLHDAARDAYPFWCFDSNGLMGTQWLLKWNGDASAAVGRSTDSPPAWTSGGQNRFPDANTNLVSYWMRDENGELLLENSGRKDRLPAEREAAIVAAWKKHEPPADLLAELKVLDRMIGTWDTVSTMKPAEWTPEGDSSTAKIKREWILNGRFVMDTSIHSNGDESIALIGYDLGQKAYRSWWFNSQGEFPRSPSTGSWNESKQTLSYVSELGDGKTMRSSVRFADPNQEVSELLTWAPRLCLLRFVFLGVV